MTIGIAIPNIGAYKHLLTRLLDNISRQTVLPDMVSIAMSEGQWSPERDYPFEVIVDCTDNVRGLAQNCNIALSGLDTDIMTIMHGDDLMHPQRNEYLLWAFKDNTVDVVAHGFKYSDDNGDELMRRAFTWTQLKHDYINTIVHNRLYPVNENDTEVEFLNGHLSFRRRIFNKFKYDESPSWFYDCDSEYTRRLVTNGIYISYIPHPLVLYRSHGIARDKHKAS